MSEISQLEKLYLPSQWSKRYPPDVILKKFVELTTKLSDEIREHIPCEIDIAYGDGEKQKLDIYGITLPNDAPIFIFIHGGYWQVEMVQRRTSNIMARSLYKHGCKTIIIGYTLCPHCTIAEIVQEIQKAIRKCLQYGLEQKTRSISIGGHSAGAHLAVSLFSVTFFNTLTNEEQRLIKSVFLIGGIYNLIPLVKTTMNDPLKLTEDTAKALSPMFFDFRHLATNSTQFSIIVSENDSPAFIKESKLLHDNLRKQGVKCEFEVLKELDHFDTIEKMDEDNYVINKLILTSLQ